MKRTPIGIFGRGMTAAVPAAFVAFGSTVFARTSLLPPFGGSTASIVWPTVVTYVVVFVILWFVPEGVSVNVKTPVNPEQRMRVLKIVIIALLSLPLLVLGWAYVYQNLWPKKPILVDRVEDQPGYSTNRGAAGDL